MAFFVLSRCFLDFSVGVRASVIGLSQISSFSHNHLIYFVHYDCRWGHTVWNRKKKFSSYDLKDAICTRWRDYFALGFCCKSLASFSTGSIIIHYRIAEILSYILFLQLRERRWCACCSVTQQMVRRSSTGLDPAFSEISYLRLPGRDMMK